MNIINTIKNLCLKKKDIKEHIFNDNTDEICIIGLNNFTKDEIIIKLKCNHYYHTHCIYAWFEKKPTCPICDDILKIEL